MARIISKCQRCGKVAVEKSRCTIGRVLFITLECGHTYTSDLQEMPAAPAAAPDANASDDKSTSDEIILLDERKLRPYQKDGVKFLVGCDFRGAIFDEMGLG